MVQKELIELYSAGYFSETIDRTKNLLIQDPKNIFLYNIQGLAFMGLKKFDNAIESMNQLLRIDPTFADAYFNIASTLNIMDNTEGAMQNYKQTVQLNPQYFEAYIAMGDILYNQYKYNDAMINYAKALQIKPEYALVHYKIANILLHEMRHEEAVLFYNHAINLQPDYSEAYNNLGLALTAINKNEDAIINYNKALIIDDNNPITLNNLANSFYHLQKYNDAIFNYTRAVTINPHYAEAYNNLATTYQEIGILDKAVLNYKKSINNNSNYSEPILNLIPILIQLNKTKDVIKMDKVQNNIMYKVYLILCSFIDGLFIKTKSLIDELESKINETSLSPLDKNNKKFTLTYLIFLSKLNSHMLQTEDKLSTEIDTNIIYHLGESHSLSFAHQNVNIKDKTFTIKPLIIFGAKAWHLSQNKENKYKSFFQNHINSLKKGSYILLSFGEIDCRVDAGIINYHLKTGLNLHEIICKTVQGYVDYTQEVLSGLEMKVSYMGVPAPVIIKNQQEEYNSSLRIEIVKIFNECLSKLTHDRKLNFIDVYNLTVNDQGTSNLKYMCDDFHLDPSSIKNLKLTF